jgi:serine/threonine protein kinase
VWLAPEVMAGKVYTEKADVYSIGVILWELVTRKPFFGEVRFMSQLEDMVKAGERPPIPDDCTPAYRQLIEECWAPQPGTTFLTFFRN